MALKDNYYTISEVAKELNVTRQTVSRLIATGNIQVEKIGREVLVERKAVRQLQERNLREALHNLVLAHVSDYLRDNYGYGKEDKIEQVRPYRNARLVLRVDRKDGTSEIVWVYLGKVEVNQDDTKPLLSVKIKKADRKGYHASKEIEEGRNPT